jgi:tRNA(fMet)-specific endonuclease VapC
MTSYLLDTNHLGWLINTQHPLRARVQAAIDVGDIFCIIVPVITETVAGFSILPRAKQNLVEWQVLRPHLSLQQLDEDDAMKAAELQVLLRRAGRDLKTVDALIAATALRYNLTLLTTDRDFTPIRSLRLENWLAS